MKKDSRSTNSLGNNIWKGEWIDPQLKPFLIETIERMEQLPDPRTRPIANVRKGFEDALDFWNNDSPFIRLVRDETIPGPFGDVKVRIYSDTPARIDWFWDCDIPDKKQRKNPLAVPILAEMQGLPPVYNRSRSRPDG
ncbi:MAG: hypothetical protein DRP57_08640 [Spirochaetes bacterium]|nr:MAG: hypothetical protein DRP57_08640 [Spirochaetota bacterium]